MEHDIHPEDTLVFLHIPKTGGITLGACIDPMWLPGARCPEYLTFPLARLPRESLPSYRSYTGHFNMQALRQLLPAGFHCVTMLRQPLARHISFLHMLKWISTFASQPSRLELLHHIGNPLLFQILQYASQGDSQALLRHWQAASLEELIDDQALQRSLGLVDSQTQHISPLRRPAIPAAGEEWFDQARQALASMTCFGLTERFQDSLFLLSFVFGWQPLLDTLRHNETLEKTNPDSLPPASRAKLESYNQHDLELYAFAQDEFQRRFEQMCQVLLERHGSRAQAHRRLPLPKEELVALLERHYRQRFIQREALPAPGQPRFTFHQPAASAAGWQRLEISPVHGPFRWTGPGTAASIDLPVPSGALLRLQVAVIGASHPELLDGLRVFVNQESLPHRRLSQQSGETVIEVNIPPQLAEREPFLRLTLETAYTSPIQADDPANPDPRQVGIAVKWIDIQISTKEVEE